MTPQFCFLWQDIRVNGKRERFRGVLALNSPKPVPEPDTDGTPDGLVWLILQEGDGFPDVVLYLNDRLGPSLKGENRGHCILEHPELLRLRPDRIYQPIGKIKMARPELLRASDQVAQPPRRVPRTFAIIQHQRENGWQSEVRPPSGLWVCLLVELLPHLDCRGGGWFARCPCM